MSRRRPEFAVQQVLAVSRAEETASDGNLSCSKLLLKFSAADFENNLRALVGRSQGEAGIHRCTYFARRRERRVGEKPQRRVHSFWVRDIGDCLCRYWPGCFQLPSVFPGCASSVQALNFIGSLGAHFGFIPNSSALADKSFWTSISVRFVRVGAVVARLRDQSA